MQKQRYISHLEIFGLDNSEMTGLQILMLGQNKCNLSSKKNFFFFHFKYSIMTQEYINISRNYWMWQ